MLAVSTVWRLAVSTRLLGRWPAPGWTLDLHRYLGGLALTFTGVHLAALLLNTYIQFDLLDLLVPFAAAWRPGAVAWGVVAVYLLIAVQATSLARRRLPHRLWRRVHLAAFIDKSGTAEFGGALKVGDTKGVVSLPGLSTDGLLDAAAADVYLVVRDHGPAERGIVQQQIHSFDVCDSTCTDLQMSAHLASLSQPDTRRGH